MRSAALALQILNLSATAVGQGRDALSIQVSGLDGAVFQLVPPLGPMQVVLFWQPDHTRAKSALCEIARLSSAGDAPPLSPVTPGQYSRAQIEQAVRECSVQPPRMLIDPERRAFAALGIVALPTALVIDSQGRVLLRLAGFGPEAAGRLKGIMQSQSGKPSQQVQTGGRSLASERFELAQRLLRLGMGDKAEAQFRALTKDFPEFRPAWVAAGYRAVSRENVNEAFDSLDRAVSLDPANPDVAPGLAWVWTKRGDEIQASKWIRSADRNGPNYAIIETLRRSIAGKETK